MARYQEQKRKKDLGIFYTPPEVVGFIFDILNIWKGKEEKETGRWESKKHYPSVIDPAVGEGVFLKAALESGFTKTDWIFGLDIDGNVVKKWKDINLLKEFGGKEDELEAHFFHQNGLDRIHWEQHTKKYRYKLKQKDIEDQQFNLVVGNPPYGGLGIYEEMKMLSESVLSARKVQKIYNQKIDTLFGEQEEKIIKTTTTEHVKLPLSQVKIFELKELSKNLINLGIWKDKKYLPPRINHNLNINGVEINLKDILTLKEIERLKSFPIEILFLERFIQLAKPGGWIAIIVPDGILANSNSHFVREFIAEKTKVEAIVSLSRGTFREAGTSAKTSILFLKKLKEDEKLTQNYPMFLSSVEKNNEDNFQKIAELYQKLYNLKGETMDKTNLVQITKDQTGKEAVMVRVDKTLKEMMEEKPASRWDTGYWHPRFGLGDFTKFKTKPLDDFIEHITYGQVGRREFVKKASDTKCYLAAKNFIPTGIDWALKENFIKIGGWNDPKRSKPEIDDVLLIGVGVATTGRVAIVHKIENDFNFGQDVKLIRLNKKEINPYYVCLFLKSFFGQSQINRLKTGVGTLNLDFDEIKSIKIPILNESVQKNIESEYKKMSGFHDIAMEAKKNNDEAEYKKNIEIAGKMLKDLISKTEAVIRGEQEDIL